MFPENLRTFKRDPIGMRLDTYEVQPANNLPMSEFLTSEWKNKDKPTWKDIFEMRT